METTPRPKSAIPGNPAGLVTARVAELRELAQSDAPGARDQAWRWLSQAGQGLRTDRRAATSELAALFAAGRPPALIDGETEGALIGWAAAPVPDYHLTALTDRWLP